MTDAGRVLTGGEALDLAVRDVRLRWRLKHALRGGALAVAIAAASWIVLAILMKSSHYNPAMVMLARVVAAAVTFATVWRFVVRPLRDTPDATRVALYVEEHERALGGAFVTAVEVNQRSANRVAAGGIAARLVRAALDGIRRVESGKRVDAGDLKKSVGLFLSVSLGVFMIFVAGPATLRTGAQ